ncbi:class I SAM-dependent methyltransferase [Mycolicibacterium sp. CH28]|uniref:class I SAM-dependent methyltransferase n=1 Tax=Mycolicibacterium sp. CH28 TaxID=2512237 RepID=UPI00108119A8|nr:class I SAM-dependent methyltransferase [Mycolicibacterium sp. CH28]TGD84840.1 class I SAM-dependent methyltransferase [Mycolicibacterium sp. CH28]
MSAFVTDAGDSGLPLTGERTVPGLAKENYWFRRHEVVYLRLADLCAGRDVLEAGCGEGYGADLIASVARQVIAVDYDAAAVAHVRARYPRVQVVAGNLASLPLPDASVDVVVNFQVIEHLWDQPQFVAECLRVLRPGGHLLMSTPNRITFSPGQDTPVNPFHTRELNARELAELLTDGGFAIDGMYGVFHGPRLTAMDARHGGSIIDAQIARALADAPWSDELLADVAAVRSEDFDIIGSEPIPGSLRSCPPEPIPGSLRSCPPEPIPGSLRSSPPGERDIDESLDLVAIAVRP